MRAKPKKRPTIGDRDEEVCFVAAGTTEIIPFQHPPGGEVETTDRVADQSRDRSHVAGDQDSPDASERLRSLRSRIVADRDILARLFADAVARKIALGEMLAEAQACCHVERIPWRSFLGTVGLSERTTREAIQFYRNKTKIEGMRHGGAALNVSDVRFALISPGYMKAASRGKARGKAVFDPASGSTTQVISAGQDKRPNETSVVDVSPLAGRAEDPNAVDATDSEARSASRERQGEAATSTSIRADPTPAEDSLQPNGLVEYYEGFDELTDSAIGELKAGMHYPEIGRLRRTIPIISDALVRLESALNSIDFKEETR